MIYSLVPETDPILHNKVQEYNFNEADIKAVELSKILIDNMFYYNGLGLSANQIGLPYRAFSMQDKEPIVCINPTIISIADEEVATQEGCLSFPDLYLTIKRPNSITVSFFDNLQDKHICNLTDLAARIFLHEYDHLNGIVFTSKISKYFLKSARKKQFLAQRKLNKKNGKKYSTKENKVW